MYGWLAMKLIDIKESAIGYGRLMESLGDSSAVAGCSLK